MYQYWFYILCCNCCVCACLLYFCYLGSCELIHLVLPIPPHQGRVPASHYYRKCLAHGGRSLIFWLVLWPSLDHVMWWGICMYIHSEAWCIQASLLSTDCHAGLSHMCWQLWGAWRHHDPPMGWVVSCVLGPGVIGRASPPPFYWLKCPISHSANGFSIPSSLYMAPSFLESVVLCYPACTQHSIGCK